MNNKTNIADQLLEISQSIKTSAESRKRTQESICKLAKSLLPGKPSKRSLKPDHIRVLARLFDKTMSETCRAESLTLLREVFGTGKEYLKKLDIVVDLIDCNLLECSEKRYIRTQFRDRGFSMRLDRSILIDSYVRITPLFLSFLLNDENSVFSSSPKPFYRNREFVEFWFSYVDTVHAYRSESDDEDAPYLEVRVIAKRQELEGRSEVTKKSFPFHRIVEEYKLDHDEQVLLMYVLKESVNDCHVSEGEFVSLLKHTKFEKYTKPSILSKNSTLMKEGLILPVSIDGLILGDGSYEIAPEIASEILSDSKRPIRAIVDDIVKREDLFEIITPTKKMADMVLPKETTDTVKRAISRFNRGSHELLSGWGIYDKTNGERTDANDQDCSKLVMLFHGPPGTGKTALAHAVAHSMRRVLLTTDISRIIDKWVGESQKRLSRLFLLYRKILKRSGRAPVLLLNEADQLISKRGGVDHAVDRMYNQLQNILLENLENFQGILLATTNMIENFDEAFSRRFDFKLNLSPPTCSERKQLWQILTPKKLPLDNDVNKSALAKAYNFTGAQIELVIRNTAIAVADRSKKEQVVTQADLIKYADLEERSSFDKSNRKSIGFK